MISSVPVSITPRFKINVVALALLLVHAQFTKMEVCK